jgi:hypothetical protein
MLVDKKTNHKKLDNNWKKVVQQGTTVLNDNNKKNKVDEYSKISEEVKTLQIALTEKETKLKKDKSSLTEVQDAINNEKASFADATKKGG